MSAPAALALGLAPAALAFTLSLAPLTLTVGTMLGISLGGSVGRSRWGRCLGVDRWGRPGFAAAAAAVGVLAADFTVGSQLTRIAVPMAVYTIPLLLGFVLNAARDDHEWWNSVVRWLQQAASRISPTGAAALPDRAAEVLRLTGSSACRAADAQYPRLRHRNAGGVCGHDSLSQGLHTLDGLRGADDLFCLPLAFLPTAWVWTIFLVRWIGFRGRRCDFGDPFDLAWPAARAAAVWGNSGELGLGGWACPGDRRGDRYSARWSDRWAPTHAPSVFARFCGSASTCRRFGGACRCTVLRPRERIPWPRQARNEWAWLVGQRPVGLSRWNWHLA